MRFDTGNPSSMSDGGAAFGKGKFTFISARTKFVFDPKINPTDLIDCLACWKSPARTCYRPKSMRVQFIETYVERRKLEIKILVISAGVISSHRQLSMLSCPRSLQC